MRRSFWWGFAGLCVLGGSTWLGDTLFLSAWPTLLRLGVHDFAACAGLVAAGLVLRTPKNERLRWKVALWSCVLFAVPVILSAAAGGKVPSTTGVLVFALVPFFTVFAVAQRQGGELRLLMPSAIAVGGLALVVPFGWPPTAAGVGWLIGMVVAAGLTAWAGLRLQELMQDVPLIWSAAEGAGAAGVMCFAGWRVLQPGPVAWNYKVVGTEALWGLVVDGTLVALTFWMLREMRPVASSTRYLAVPLVTLLGGMLVMRPHVEWTTWLGLASAAGGSWMLLRDEVEGAEEGNQTIY